MQPGGNTPSRNNSPIRRPPLHPNLCVTPLSTQRTSVAPTRSKKGPKNNEAKHVQVEASYVEEPLVLSDRSLDRKGRDELRTKCMADASLNVPSASGVGSIFGRLFMLMLGTAAAVVCSASLYTFSVQWLYNGNASPILGCPTEVVVGHDSNLDGSHCLITFYFDDIHYYREASVMFGEHNERIKKKFGDTDVAKQCRILSTQGQYSECTSAQGCVVKCPSFRSCVSSVPTDKPGSCARGSGLTWATTDDPTVYNKNIKEGGCTQDVELGLEDDSTITVVNTAVTFDPFCDAELNVNPADILAIWGLMLASLGCLVAYAAGEYFVHKYRRSRALSIKAGMEIMAVDLPTVQKEMREVVERRWGPADKTFATPRTSITSPKSDGGSPIHNGPKFETGSIKDHTPSPMSAKSMKVLAQSHFDPRKRFQSSSWRYRLRLMFGLKSKQKAMERSRQRQQSVLLILAYFCLVVGIMAVVLEVCPDRFVVTSPRSLAGFLYGHSISWVDLVSLFDVFAEVLLLLISALFVKWPQHFIPKSGGSDPSHTEETQANGECLEKDGGKDENSSGGSPTGCSLMSNELCIMITCHYTCLDEYKREKFIALLNRCLCMLPPSAIFVVDNADCPSPADDTWRVCYLVHPDINYIYIPEGNKSLGVYWTNKVWIPYLHKNKRCPLFRYAIVCDDDVTLPPDLVVSTEYLRQNADIRAVHFPTTAWSRESGTNLVTQLQDIQLKTEAIRLMTQSQLSRCLHAQEGVCLWERSALDAVLYEHGTVVAQEHEYSGILLLRQRDVSIMSTNAATAVATVTPSTIGEVFARRTESGQEVKFLMSYLRELLWLPSFVHMQSVLLKPYIFFGPVLTSVVDIIRPVLFASLIFRDPLCLALLLVIYLLCAYLSELFVVVVLSRRKDLRRSWGVPLVVLPAYRFFIGLTRLAASLHFVVGPSAEKNTLRIGVRVDDIRDIPPCPPSADVDWFTVWLAEKSTKGSVEASPDADLKSGANSTACTV